MRYLYLLDFTSNRNGLSCIFFPCLLGYYIDSMLDVKVTEIRIQLISAFVEIEIC